MNDVNANTSPTFTAGVSVGALMFKVTKTLPFSKGRRLKIVNPKAPGRSGWRDRGRYEIHAAFIVTKIEENGLGLVAVVFVRQLIDRVKTRTRRSDRRNGHFYIRMYAIGMMQKILVILLLLLAKGIVAE
jgi:hypothetical protein